jgi:ATP-dependent DNA ligase
VCKQLESPWKPDDRSGCWVKMKPEYTGQQQLDCVIIAVYLGNGSRGGQVGGICVCVVLGAAAAVCLQPTKSCAEPQDL